MLLLNNFINRLQLFHPIKLGIICFFIEILNSLIFAFVFPDVKGGEFVNIYEEIIVAGLVAPLVETYFIQHLVIQNVLKYSKGNSLLAWILSAIVFGLAHTYSVVYVAKTFVSGLIFGILYLTLAESTNKAFLYVAATHSAFNFFAISINHLFP